MVMVLVMAVAVLTPLYLVIILVCSRIHGDTVYHMTKRNAARIFRVHLMIYCHFDCCAQTHIQTIPPCHTRTSVSTHIHRRAFYGRNAIRQWLRIPIRKFSQNDTQLNGHTYYWHIDVTVDFVE